MTDMLSTAFGDLQSNLEANRVLRLRKALETAISDELTPVQRETLIAYYFQNKNIPQIAWDRGVNKSSVCRTLHRAEARLQKVLKYVD